MAETTNDRHEGQTEEGREYLELCAQRALHYFDKGSVGAAISSVLQDFGNSWITQELYPGSVRVLLERAAQGGREAFERAVLGFRV